MANPTGAKDTFIPNPKSKLFEQVREVMRFHHYSYRTEKTCSQWIRRYLAFHRGLDRSGTDRGWRHPRNMGASEVEMKGFSIWDLRFTSAWRFGS